MTYSRLFELRRGMSRPPGTRSIVMGLPKRSSSYEKLESRSSTLKSSRLEKRCQHCIKRRKQAKTQNSQEPRERAEHLNVGTFHICQRD